MSLEQALIDYLAQPKREAFVPKRAPTQLAWFKLGMCVRGCREACDHLSHVRLIRAHSIDEASELYERKFPAIKARPGFHMIHLNTFASLPKVQAA